MISTLLSISYLYVTLPYVYYVGIVSLGHEVFATLCAQWVLLLRLLHTVIRGPPLNIQGGGAGVFVAGKLFISTGLGGALKISHFITCLYRTVLEVNYLFHAESARNYLFQKNSGPPPPWKSNGGPLKLRKIEI